MLELIITTPYYHEQTCISDFITISHTILMVINHGHCGYKTIFSRFRLPPILTLVNKQRCGWCSHVVSSINK